MAEVEVPKRGDVLGGKYRVEREVGSGGMGIVFEVTHLVMTEKRLAVKWLLPLPDGSDAARRFIREARIAGSIRHPHVVDVYDITIEEAGCFMVMELLEGESLEMRLERAGPIEPHEACRILLQCLSGVAAAHAAGVIHRDLKPANIFLCRRSAAEPVHPKVLDFGISRVVAPRDAPDTTETRKGVLVGTPSYMAPEQLRGVACDNRTDVYALGITLYEALSGARAYEAPTYADLVVRIVTGDAVDLSRLSPKLPAGLADIVMRAMHHDPKRRFPSVEAFAAALQPYAAAGVIEPEAGSRGARGAGPVIKQDATASGTWRERVTPQPLAAARSRVSWWFGAGLSLVIAAVLAIWFTARRSDEAVHRVVPAPIVVRDPTVPESQSERAAPQPMAAEEDRTAQPERATAQEAAPPSPSPAAAARTGDEAARAAPARVPEAPANAAAEAKPASTRKRIEHPAEHANRKPSPKPLPAAPDPKREPKPQPRLTEL